MTTVLIAILTLGILVTVHEFGHFWVARRCGVRVLKFSIGFGPSLWSRTGRDGVEYVVAAIPLGGFVRMAGENDDDSVDIPKSEWFNLKPVSQRIAIAAAGPLINLLLAVVILTGLAFRGEVGLAPIVGSYEPSSILSSHALVEGVEITAVDGEPVSTWREVNMALLERAGDSGEIIFTLKYPNSDVRYTAGIQIEAFMAEGEIRDPLEALGISPWRPETNFVIAQIVPGGAADEAGLKLGDEILLTDGQSFDSFDDWASYISERPSESIVLSVKRDMIEQDIVITPQPQELNEVVVGRIGVGLTPLRYPEEMIRRFHYSIPEAFGVGVERTYDTSIFILNSIVKMLRGDISAKNLSGPISIAKVASDSAESGIFSWLGVLALLSVSLGVLNLLPIPMLDGGHLLFYMIEAVKGSPLSETIQQYAMQAGVALVLLVTVMAIYNDILRL